MSIATEPSEWPECLTDAERDVVRRCLLDQRHAEIAEARGTTVSTVASQMASIFEKQWV
ncbi:MAG: helix-turn-helix transcriptional regulator [Myxococcota bacterium]